jgi:hypothetical protein
VLLRNTPPSGWAPIGTAKAKRAGELKVHGSGALTRWLLENDLPGHGA